MDKRRNKDSYILQKTLDNFKFQGLIKKSWYIVYVIINIKTK